MFKYFAMLGLHFFETAGRALNDFKTLQVFSTFTFLDDLQR